MVEALLARGADPNPISVAQTRCVLFAKQLIHQTGMWMTKIAPASEFGSIQRSNATFQELFQRPQSASRLVREEPQGGKNGDPL
jgi:transcriptional regulator GlxA family with amidase domain